MIDDFIKIFERDITKLKLEIQSFASEENLWKTMGAIKNPAGNLCLHLSGNLNTYIGKNMGGRPYTRDRDAEFSAKGLSKKELVAIMENTGTTVVESLKTMNNKDLDAFHMEDVLGYRMTNRFFLLHLSGHLAYHSGQINYLRRMLEPGSK